MSYLEEFQNQIQQRAYNKILPLWEEYCGCDQPEKVDGQELLKLLRLLQISEFVQTFGKKVDLALSLWRMMPDSSMKNEVLSLIFDLQTTNSKELAEIALQIINDKYKNDKNQLEKLRLVGLKNKENFQGAIRNYDLLSHIDIGNFVFHSGGWGTGQILGYSMVREQITLELENVSGKKEVAFEHAYKTLIPLPKTHFLAKRFGHPDELEAEAKKEPTAVIYQLLSDLGPRTALEIRDELIGLVIPEKEWSRWWQNTRAKLKKDSRIHVPENLRLPFIIHADTIDSFARLEKKIALAKTTPEKFLAVHNFLAETEENFKIAPLNQKIIDLCTSLVSNELTCAQNLQIKFFLQEITPPAKNSTAPNEIEAFLSTYPVLQELIREIEINGHKKKILMIAREQRADWIPLFIDIFFDDTTHLLRDYLLKELVSEPALEMFKAEVRKLIIEPTRAPYAFFWLSQKLFSNVLPASIQHETFATEFFESFLILIAQIEASPRYRELAKKMYALLTQNRYAIIRKMIEKNNEKVTEEFLLLASKCRLFTESDTKILHSLAEVVFPNLTKRKKNELKATEQNQVLWATPESYRRMKERLERIASIDTVENAKEIEAARALGDLRENSEFKYALEKRSRLQTEITTLTKQLAGAKILTPDDISTATIGVGTIFCVEDASGKETYFTILGPWDANPERNILSSNSKLAQAFFGLHVGDNCSFQNDEYVIKRIENFFTSRHHDLPSPPNKE